MGKRENLVQTQTERDSNRIKQNRKIRQDQDKDEDRSFYEKTYDKQGRIHDSISCVPMAGAVREVKPPFSEKK